MSSDSDADLKATGSALNDLTDFSFTAHSVPPKAQLHREADKDHARSLLLRFMPTDTLERLESVFADLHMGNYVMERHTEIKTFEPMSIYVRLGMYLLYYGSSRNNEVQ